MHTAHLHNLAVVFVQFATLLQPIQLLVIELDQALPALFHFFEPIFAQNLLEQPKLFVTRRSLLQYGEARKNCKASLAGPVRICILTHRVLSGKDAKFAQTQIVITNVHFENICMLLVLRVPMLLLKFFQEGLTWVKKKSLRDSLLLKRVHIANL